MKCLLGKSTDRPDAPRGEESLVGHTRLVMAASVTLVEQVGADSLRAVGLPVNLLPRLGRIVHLAALVHDLGKCSEHFQHMVRGAPLPQLFRHEAVSLWLCWPRSGSPLSGWLRGAVETDVDLLLAVLAAAAHHRKFPQRAIRDEGAGDEVKLFCGHDDFHRLLATSAAGFGLSPPPLLTDLVMSGAAGAGPTSDLRFNFENALEEVGLSEDDRKLLAIAKALVIAADVAGSALPRTDKGPGWLNHLLALQATTGLEKLISRGLSGNALRPFQQQVGASTAPVTLVKAGCGSGKTLAAWLWGSKHPARQFWLCYPTTGTTTEGYRDYVKGADIHGFIEHGRSSVDVELFGLSEGLGDEDVVRDAERLRALRQWGADAITCTVDTVLGLLQNQRKGLYAWPGLARSVVVFDEIHSFDDSLFGLLLAWLRALPGVPTLLMTASLPEERLRALRTVVQQVHSQPLAEIDGPAELEALPRYLLSTEDADALAERTLNGHGKVLWVSNTVKRCMAVRSRGAWARGGLLYHSRYRYCDRVERHREVINAFRSEGAVLALTTQVAEMSLDLSADLLVTELAPISSLIQRLGRLNRRSTPERPVPPKPFVVIEPSAPEPYEREDLEAARRWLESLGTGALSQADLIKAWESSNQPVPGPTQCAWLCEAYSTEPHGVREASPGISVLLERDAQRVQRRELDVVKVALPMNSPPKTTKVAQWSRVAYHPVAPANAISYDEREGASWL